MWKWIGFGKLFAELVYRENFSGWIVLQSSSLIRIVQEKKKKKKKKKKTRRRRRRRKKENGRSPFRVQGHRRSLYTMGRHSKKAGEFASKATRFQAPSFHPFIWWPTQRPNLDRFQNLRRTRRWSRRWSLPPRIQVLFCYLFFFFHVLLPTKNDGVFKGFYFLGRFCFLLRRWRMHKVWIFLWICWWGSLCCFVENNCLCWWDLYLFVYLLCYWVLFGSELLWILGFCKKLMLSNVFIYPFIHFFLCYWGQVGWVLLQI